MVREAGLEPARPEWTLEPERKKVRFSTYRQVLLRIAQSVEKTGFLIFFPAKPTTAPGADKQYFVEYLLDV